MEWYEVLSILGIGALLSTVISVVMDRVNKKLMLREENLISMKIERYRSLLVFMNLVLKPDDIVFVVSNDKEAMFGKNSKDNEIIKKHYFEQVKGFYFHLFLFANEDVINNVKSFIDEPSKEKFVNTSKAMRKDIWNKKFLK